MGGVLKGRLMHQSMLTPAPPRPGHSGAFAGTVLFDERKGHRYRGLWPLLHVIQEQRGSGPGYFPQRWTGSRIASPARWRLLAMKRSQESFYVNHLISLAEYAIRPWGRCIMLRTHIYNWLFCEQKSFVTVFARNLFWKSLDWSSMSPGVYILFFCIFKKNILYMDRSVHG